MGRRDSSRSPKSSRRNRSKSPRSSSSRHERRRSRDRSRERERERRDRKSERSSRYSDEEKKPDAYDKKSNSKAILAAKKAMKESLNAAATSIASSSFAADNDVEDEEMAASRSHLITQIDEGEFRQRAFKSTIGGSGAKTHVHQEKKSVKRENEHESAIFGPSLPLKQTEKEEEPIEDEDSLVKKTDGDVFPSEVDSMS